MGNLITKCFLEENSKKPYVWMRSFLHFFEDEEPWKISSSLSYPCNSTSSVKNPWKPFLTVREALKFNFHLWSPWKKIVDGNSIEKVLWLKRKFWKPTSMTRNLSEQISCKEKMFWTVFFFENLCKANLSDEKPMETFFPWWQKNWEKTVVEKSSKIVFFNENDFIPLKSQQFNSFVKNCCETIFKDGDPRKKRLFKNGSYINSLLLMVSQWKSILEQMDGKFEAIKNFSQKHMEISSDEKTHCATKSIYLKNNGIWKNWKKLIRHRLQWCYSQEKLLNENSGSRFHSWQNCQNWPNSWEFRETQLFRKELQGNQV